MTRSSSYRHGLRIHHYHRTWRYYSAPHPTRRNTYRAARSATNRNLQINTQNYFRYHFFLPTNAPLASIASHEYRDPESESPANSVALVIPAPETTDTNSASIYSITVLNLEDLYPSFSAPIA